MATAGEESGFSADCASSRCRATTTIEQHARNKQFVAIPLVAVDRPRANAGDVPFAVDIWLIERRDVEDSESWLDRHVSPDWAAGSGTEE